MRRWKTGAQSGCKVRSQRGLSLVELVVSTLIMTFVSTAIFALLANMGTLSQKVSNKMDSVNAARTVLEKISQDVRTGRSLGDVFGSQVILSPATATSAVVMGTQGSDVFPAQLNPVYGAGQQPPNGGWPWGGGPYQLNRTTLIVQVPVFTGNGFPTAIPAGSGNPAAATVQDNVETHIYRVVADPDVINHPGEYVLQVSRIPGFMVNGYAPGAVNSRPQTILSGIVGPFDAQGNLNVFQYLDKTNDATAGDTSISNPALIANYTGVIVNLEILKHEDGNLRPQALAVKTEVFLRNNALATTVGQPSTVN